MMKSAYLLPVAAALMAAGAHAQPTWRCGNVYTNIAADAQAKTCKLVEGGNVTVISGTRPNGNAAAGTPGVKVATAPMASPPGGARIDSGEQRARDADARAILESELKKAETRQIELLKEWNNGEPEKLGPEHRNHQKYLDRVAELKASIARNESDIVGLRRELGRAAATSTVAK
jgi:hypothetical protein